MFATGIENSIPTINHGKTRVDEMEVVRPLRALARGFRLRPGNRDQLSCATARRSTRPTSAPASIDWEFADLTFAELKRRDITPIVDLCHFGVPDWIGNFQNPDFPRLFADLCRRVRRALSRGCSSTRRSTRCSSARSSRRNTAGGTSRRRTTRSFVTALKHIVKANVMAMIEILKRRHDAIFIQSESSEYYHADSARRDRPRRSAQPDALPQPRPQLRPPGRQRDVPISAG